MLKWRIDTPSLCNVNITVYMNKGDSRDCNNYRGISLLSIIGKAFVQVALKRLQMLAEWVYHVTAALRQKGLPLTWSSLSGSYRRRAMNRGNPCISLPSIWPRPLTWSAGEDCLDNWKGSDGHQNCWASSSPFMRSCREQYILMDHHQRHSQSAVAWNRAASLQQPLWDLLLPHDVIYLQIIRRWPYLNTRSESKLFNLVHLRTKTKEVQDLIWEMFSTDNTTMNPIPRLDFRDLSTA